MNKELFNTLYRLTKNKALNDETPEFIQFDQSFTLGDTLLDALFIGIDRRLYFSCTKYLGTKDETIKIISVNSQNLSEKTGVTEQEVTEVILKIITYLQYKLAGIPNPKQEEQENKKQATTLILSHEELVIGVYTSLENEDSKVLEDIQKQIEQLPEVVFKDLDDLANHLVTYNYILNNHPINKAIILKREDNNPRTIVKGYFSKKSPQLRVRNS